MELSKEPKNLVLITSVINTVNKRLSYCKYRSLFTKEERFKQTIYTIESVRKHIPNSYIYLIECSVDIDKEEETLKPLVDTYVNCYSIDYIRNAVTSPHKGIGEMNFLLYFLNNFENLGEFEHFFKLSGRYYLNDKFDFSQFEEKTNIFRHRQTLVTIFYKIHKDYYETFIDILKRNINNPRTIECIFLAKIKNLKKVRDLGVSGMMFNKKFISR